MNNKGEGWNKDVLGRKKSKNYNNNRGETIIRDSRVDILMVDSDESL